MKNRADSVFVELEISEQEFAKVKDINQRIVKASGRLKELQLMRRVEVLNTMYLEIIKNMELALFFWIFVKKSTTYMRPLIATTANCHFDKQKKRNQIILRRDR